MDEGLVRVRSLLINITEKIDSLPVSWYQVYVAFLCGLIALLDGFDTQAMAIAAPTLAAAWQIPLADFGGVLSASLLGLMIGALSLGSLGDKFGRKNIILVSFTAVGVFSFLTAFSSSLAELWIYRFLTGIGLGGTIPNAIALTAEYAPARRKTVFVAIMFCGFPLGAAFGGFIADQIIADYSWRAIFWIGGVLPVLFSFALFFLLPESIYFLARGNNGGRLVSKCLSRMDPDFTPTGDEKYTVDVGAEGGEASVFALLAPDRIFATSLIWMIFFLNLLMLYFLLSWLPGLMSDAGLSRDVAFRAVGIFNLGGVVGGVALSFACDRWGVIRVLVPTFILTGIAIIATGQLFGQLELMYTAIFFAGVGVVGGQLALNVIAAMYYPTAIRSTGLGWALGMGRAGSVIAPLLGGLLLSLAWSKDSIFWLLGVAAFACVWGLLVLRKKIGA